MTCSQRGFEAYNARHVAPSPPGGCGPLVFHLLLCFTLARDAFGVCGVPSPELGEGRWVSRREDWDRSSVHDYTGVVNDAPVTPSGVSVNRVLLSADPRIRI